MDFQITDLLHPKELIEKLIENYQTATYLFLCLIIFCETGLVATPFLPGDSLLFTAGMYAAIRPDILNVGVLVTVLFLSAILGDNVNYFVGRKLGVRIFDIRGLNRIIKREYLHKAEEFYAKHGGKTIIMARFVPIVRTFAPFAAGVSKMNFSRYIAFCLAGGAFWVCLLTFAGYWLGNVAWVAKNYEKVILGIVALSVLPILFSVAKAKLSKKPAA